MPDVIRWRRLSRKDALASVQSLTPRETQVAYCFALGMDPERTGRQLGMSPKTVDIHSAAVRRKLACPNWGIAVTMFLANGFGWPSACDGAPEPEESDNTA